LVAASLYGKELEMRARASCCALLAAALLSAGVPACASDEPEWILTDKGALVLGTPEVLSDWGVQWTSWSPDGRFIVLALTQMNITSKDLPPPFINPTPLKGVSSLRIWDRRTHESTVAWRRPSGEVRLNDVVWLGNTVLLVQADRVKESDAARIPERALFRLDAARGLTRPVGELADGEHVSTSPSQPIAAIVSRSPSGARATILRELEPPKPYDFPGADHLSLAWPAAGGNVYVGLLGLPAESGKGRTVEWYTMDLKSGARTRVAGPPENGAVHKSLLPFSLRFGYAEIKRGGASARLKPLWMEAVAESDYSRTLICADVDYAEAAPDGSAVLYTANGSAWLVPVMPRPKELVLAALEERMARTCRANLAALASGQSAFALRYGRYSSIPMSDYDPANPSAGGLIGAPEGFAATFGCPKGSSYDFKLEDGAFTAACPNADKHAQRTGTAADYSKTLSRPEK
jgi:hypothetical protein